MGEFKTNTEIYFKQHNIQADVKQDDVLGPKKVKAIDILFGSKNDKVVNNMSDIFPQSKKDN
ncbi:MAG: hypothetical protein MJ180_01760 [Candidatus Gastranaerophilales bacterium]|nr:hypothetical protein [Candidatus Gastranaerophilales bacterium]